MTQLYKKNGAVFIPAGITVEEVEKLKDDNKVMADNYSKMEQKFYDNFTKANKLIDELSSSLSVVGECGEEECELLNLAEQFLIEHNDRFEVTNCQDCDEHYSNWRLAE